MNRQTALLLATFLCAVGPLAMAGPLRSVIVSSETGALTIAVSDHEFVQIHNFTQEGGSTRGVATVTKAGGTKNFLTATLVDDAVSSTPEPSKSVRIAGPAQIKINTVSDATLFVTYKIHVEPSPTPTPTATPITPDFTIAANPPSISIPQGGSGTITISTTQVNAPGIVNLSATVNPGGPTTSFSPASVAAGASSTLTVTVGSSVAAGSYTVTVTGTEGSVTHNTTVAVTVTAAAVSIR